MLSNVFFQRPWLLFLKEDFLLYYFIDSSSKIFIISSPLFIVFVFVFPFYLDSFVRVFNFIKAILIELASLSTFDIICDYFFAAAVFNEAFLISLPLPFFYVLRPRSLIVDFLQEISFTLMYEECFFLAFIPLFLNFSANLTLSLFVFLR